MDLTIAAIVPGINPESLRWPLTLAYIGLLGLIALYGVHRYWLVYLYAKHRRCNTRPARRFSQLPRITVQLPMFNEGLIGQRVIDAVCNLDYPAEQLEIQVLDDSTDYSAGIAKERVAHWSNHGLDIHYMHRRDRTGYKAGALNAGLDQATGQLISIFDADFLPPPNFLRRVVHYFTDGRVGMVQARWSHLNRQDSLLTRGQAIFLDGHFVVEHTARNRSGAWINFNGTAGIWRRSAIESAGGWQHDTLTEDVDLSYRAQLKGWNFVFLPWLTCPAELPPEINAFKSQQHRWTKGSIQTAIKLLPLLIRSEVSWRVKVEAFFHLTSPLVYLYITLLALLFYPAVFVNLQVVGDGTWLGVLVGMGLFGVGSVSAVVFYLASQRAQGRGVWSTLAQVPLLMAIGIGIALNNAVACLEALLGHESPFVRTPKYNRIATSDEGRQPAAGDIEPDPNPGSGVHGWSAIQIVPIPSLRRSISVLELAMGLYMLECVRLSIQVKPTLVSLPFLCLFAFGYFYIGCTSLWAHLKACLSHRQLSTPQAL